MANNLQLVPSYWASVSGGKDSLYMLKLILSNPELYPLNGVVHFELEIDYPFIKNVVDYMESECVSRGIKFLRVKPSHTWEELYYKPLPNGNITGFPTRKARWCNSKYKLSAKDNLKKTLSEQGLYLVSYIGYCVDEVKRYSGRAKNEIYPLVDFNVKEDTILAWAKNVDLFNNYYFTNRRCGCMFCPLSSMINYAYLYKYYPDKFSYMIERMRETENIRSSELGRPFSVISSNPVYNADYLENIIKLVYIRELEYLENNEQLTLF